jgi:hypothetical protein
MTTKLERLKALAKELGYKLEKKAVKKSTALYVKSVKKVVKKKVVSAVVNEALVKECLAAIKEAVKQFGSYSYDDKGPHEVMDVDVYTDQFRVLDPVIAGNTLLHLAKRNGRAEMLVSDILCNLQEWDALFEAVPDVGDYL